MNRSNKGTGSGLAHSPRSHALYQPTEPESARRASARQLRRWTTGDRPLAAAAENARRAVRQSDLDPSLFQAGVDPVQNPGESRAAKQPRDQPPPVAKPRSARTR